MPAAAVATPAVIVPPPAVEDDNPDTFALAFEQLSKLGDKPVTDEAMLGKPAATVPAVPAVPAVPENKEITPPGDASVAPAVVAGTDGEDELPDPDNPEAKVAEAEAARIAAEAAKAPVETKPQVNTEQLLEKLVDRLAPKPAPARVEPPPPDFSAEESTQLQTYAKEFPDVMKAEALLRRADIGHAVKYVFGEIEKHFGPVIGIVQQLATNAHLSDLETAVDDYADVREKVIEWVGQQPSILKQAYAQVIQSGTVDDVAALISQWRASTGVGLQPKPDQATTSGQKETELPDPAKKAAAKLAPVSSKRSQTVVADPSKDDFDGAFKTFATEET